MFWRTSNDVFKFSVVCCNKLDLFELSNELSLELFALWLELLCFELLSLLLCWFKVFEDVLLFEWWLFELVLFVLDEEVDEEPLPLDVEPTVDELFDVLLLFVFNVDGVWNVLNWYVEWFVFSPLFELLNKVIILGLDWSCNKGSPLILLIK